MKVEFIGGQDESYMVMPDEVFDDGFKATIFISLEEAQEMIRQFKKLLKKEQWNEILQDE